MASTRLAQQKLFHSKNVTTEKRKFMNIIEAIEQDYMRDDIPELQVGDTIKTYIKIKEGNRERVQLFEGFVLKIQNAGIRKDRTGLFWYDRIGKCTISRKCRLFVIKVYNYLRVHPVFVRTEFINYRRVVLIY